MRWLHNARLHGDLTSTGDYSRSIVGCGRVRVVLDSWRVFGHGALIFMSRSMVVKRGSGHLQCAVSIVVLQRLSSRSPLFGTRSVSGYSDAWMTGLTWRSWKVNRSAITCRIFTSYQCQNARYASRMWRWRAALDIRRQRARWTRLKRRATALNMHRSSIKALRSASGA